MVNANRFPLSQKNSRFLWDFLISLIFVSTLCFFFEPYWNTNDDVGMSMVAHGYGFAAVSSPTLVFSNVVWGYLVRAIPQINGILGYSIITLGTLVGIGTAILFVLRQFGIGWLVSLFVILFLLVRPVLFPQFTINAGLLAVAAIACWSLYEQQENKYALSAGCVLAFCSYLVRNHEFLLIILIALPFLPWSKLLKDRTAQAAAIGLLLAISIATFIDYQAYQGSEWQAFNALDPARVPFTDFRANIQLNMHPEILSRHGYSTNDINLIHAWFFVDPAIANPTALNAMLAELGPLAAQPNSLNNGWEGIQALAHPVLLPSVLTAILLFFILPSRKLFITWVLCLMALFALGMLGRPGVLRVYIPVLALMLIAPFLEHNTNHINKRLSWYFAQVVIVVAAIFNTIQVFSDSKAAQLYSESIRENLSGFPDHTVVAWGVAFPYENVYPVLKQPESAMKYQHYSLGTDTLAPFSRAFLEEKNGTGMIARLISKEGVPIIADKPLFDLLAIYCKEHFDGDLEELVSQQYGHIHLSWRRCNTQKSQ